jgi:hypothetical protein
VTGDIRKQLTEALKAAEDLAREAAHTWVDGSTGAWKAQPDSYHSDLIVDEGNGEIVVYDEGRPTSAQALHIARWDPSTVLRLIERDRQLLVACCEVLDSGEERRGSLDCPEDHSDAAAKGLARLWQESAAALWLGTPEVDL